METKGKERAGLSECERKPGMRADDDDVATMAEQEKSLDPWNRIMQLILKGLGVQ